MIVKKGRAAPVATLLAGAACMVVALVASGGSGLLSAAIGTAVVIAFFWSGIVPLLITGDGSAAGRGVALGLLLLTYTLRLAVVLLALRIADRHDVLHNRWLGGTIIVCALVWTGTQVATLTRPSAHRLD